MTTLSVSEAVVLPNWATAKLRINTRSLAQLGGAGAGAAGSSRKSSGHEDTPCSAYTRLFRSCGALTRAAQLDTSQKEQSRGAIPTCASARQSQGGKPRPSHAFFHAGLHHSRHHALARAEGNRQAGQGKQQPARDRPGTASELRLRRLGQPSCVDAA